MHRARSAHGASPATGNPFGVVEALGGLAVGFLLSAIALSIFAAVTHESSSHVTFGKDVVSLFALWVGFVGAAVVASRITVSAGGGLPSLARRGSGSMVEDYGLRLRPLVDLPLGILVGVGAQLLLVPLLTLPLQPFVHHLNARLGHPTSELLGPAYSGGTVQLVVIAILVCVGSPLIEELFFRGLLLRGLLGRFKSLGRRLAPTVAVIVTGLVFALVHFEALQFLGLAGLGVALSLLAWRTGRIGSSVVAHMAFNTTAVIAYVFVK